MTNLRWWMCAVLLVADAIGGCAAQSSSENGGVASGRSVAAPRGPAASADSGASATGTGTSASTAFGNSAPASGSTAKGAGSAPEGPSVSSPGASGGASSDSGVPASAPAAMSGGGTSGGGNGSVEAGTLTAGAWDDNRNFDRFTSYRSDLLQQGLAGVIPTTDDEHKAAFDLASETRGARQTLDVALVIDTTGSMGDEMAYLKAEFLAISAAIESKFPDAAQRWALIAYRDVTDEYVVRSFDFETSATTFQDNLAAQNADGGGDFPESPDAALAKMSELAWRTGSHTARLAFWVADAPHHAEKAAAMADAIRAARDLDVHIYPVASSGVNELTELTMRSAAQLTLGRYLFLTDDSGVGDAHKEPTIPCYFVTRLNDAIERMVDIELTGDYHEPEPAQVIRTGGDPKNGACMLALGEEVRVF